MQRQAPGVYFFSCGEAAGGDHPHPPMRGDRVRAKGGHGTNMSFPPKFPEKYLPRPGNTPVKTLGPLFKKINFATKTHPK